MDRKELKREIVILNKKSQTMKFISSILVPIGLIAELMVFLLYPAPLTFLGAWMLVVVGFGCDAVGHRLQEEAHEKHTTYLIIAEREITEEIYESVRLGTKDLL